MPRMPLWYRLYSKTSPTKPLGMASRGLGESLQDMAPAIGMLGDQAVDAMAAPLAAAGTELGTLAGTGLGEAGAAALGSLWSLWGPAGAAAGGLAGQLPAGLAATLGGIGGTLGGAAAAPAAKALGRMTLGAGSNALQGLGTVLGAPEDPGSISRALGSRAGAMSMPLAQLSGLEGGSGGGDTTATLKAMLGGVGGGGASEPFPLLEATAPGAEAPLAPAMDPEHASDLVDTIRSTLPENQPPPPGLSDYGGARGVAQKTVGQGGWNPPPPAPLGGLSRPFPLREATAPGAPNQWDTTFAGLRGRTQGDLMRAHRADQQAASDREDAAARNASPWGPVDLDAPESVLHDIRASRAAENPSYARALAAPPYPPSRPPPPAVPQDAPFPRGPLAVGGAGDRSLANLLRPETPPVDLEASGAAPPARPPHRRLLYGQGPR